MKISNIIAAIIGLAVGFCAVMFLKPLILWAGFQHLRWEDFTFWQLLPFIPLAVLITGLWWLHKIRLPKWITFHPRVFTIGLTIDKWSHKMIRPLFLRSDNTALFEAAFLSVRVSLLWWSASFSMRITKYRLI